MWFIPCLVLALPLQLRSSTPAIGLFAYEGFDYPDGQSLAISNGGLGWNGPWSNVALIGTNTVPTTYQGSGLVVSPGPVYSGLASSGGAAFLTPSNAGTNSGFESRFYRSMLAPPGQSPGSVVWGSFVARQQNANSGRSFGVSFSQFGSRIEKFLIGSATSNSANNVFTNGTPPDAALTWGMGTFFYGDGYQQARTSAIYSQVPNSPLNTLTALLVFRVTYGSIGANNDRVDLWLNPNLVAGQDGLGTPRLSVAGDCRFDTIRINAGNTISANNLAAAGSIDEIRIGADFISAVGGVTVAIDVTPGGPVAILNLAVRGNIPVAILSTPTFDATREVNLGTVMISGAPVALRPNGTFLTSSSDVNKDGVPDLVVHVEAHALQLLPTATEITFQARTLTGIAVQGSQPIHIVAPKNQ
jgi:hypothetical protein